MAQVIAAPAPHQTVEWLISKTHLPESAVVRGLKELSARGQVSEELDLHTGHFYYGLKPQISHASEDLDSRLQRLHDEEQ